MTTPAQQVARERAIQLAEDDIPIIDALLDSPGWAYLSRRLRDLRQGYRDATADDDDLTDAQTKTNRAISRLLDDLSRLPEQDRRMHTATLDAAKRAAAATGPARG